MSPCQHSWCCCYRRHGDGLVVITCCDAKKKWNKLRGGGGHTCSWKHTSQSVPLAPLKCVDLGSEMCVCQCTSSHVCVCVFTLGWAFCSACSGSQWAEFLGRSVLSATCTRIHVRVRCWALSGATLTRVCAWRWLLGYKCVFWVSQRFFHTVGHKAKLRSSVCGCVFVRAHVCEAAGF